MTEDIIKRIAEAEAEAAAIKAEAEARAAEISTAAEKRKTEIEKTSVEVCKAYRETQIKAAENDAEKAYAKTLEETGAAAKAYADSLKHRAEIPVSEIVGRIVGGNR